jgi:ribosomal-protein-alanine N-acetyltransferase
MEKKTGGCLSTYSTLRPFRESDLSSVLAIEQTSFPSPWKAEHFLHELRGPYSRLIVAERDGQVVGYLCRWFIADEVQVLNVAVHQAHRRHGIGRLLLQEVFAEAREHGVRSVSLEVRTSNLPAIMLYEGFGFRQATVRKCYYENGEDALLMVCSLSANP